MKKVEIIQGTNEWHEFRRQGIGASEIADLLGHTNKSWKQLWEEKKGITSVFETAAMRKGKISEPLALEHIRAQTGLNLTPICGIHDEYDWIRCSFDGYSDEGIYEIKTPFSEKTLEKYSKGDIPEKWVDQVKWQTLVAGVYKGTLAIWSGDDCFFYDIVRDEEWTEKAMQCAASFWDLYTSDISPVPSDKDYIEESVDTQENSKLLEDLKRCREEKKAAEEKEKEILKTITQGKDGNFILGDVSFCKTRTTVYDYKKMIEDYGIIKESYKKESEPFWKWR